MALDGITISNIVNELNNKLLPGRIEKINQPEKDKIILSIRSNGKTQKLMLTCLASSPRITIINSPFINPASAPMFCMTLRKHLKSAKISKITQPSLERIVEIHLETYNELNDFSTKKLIIEIMGKHSNIILVNKDSIIIDSIKHISFDKSRVRQILPGLSYSYPDSQNKSNPLDTNFISFKAAIRSVKDYVHVGIYKSFIGFSPVIASELVHRANLDSSLQITQLSNSDYEILFFKFYELVECIKANKFNNYMYFEGTHIIDFSSFEMLIYKDLYAKSFATISELIESFYAQKEKSVRTFQKQSALRVIIDNIYNKCCKKINIHLNTLESTNNKEQLKIKGQLLMANMHSVPTDSSSFIADNFYEDNSKLIIELDPNLSVVDNANKYFKKYNKQKRTNTAITQQLKEAREELAYIESVLFELNSAETNEEIEELKLELKEQGYIKSKSSKDKPKKSTPHKYMSQDGICIYVGKNNIQNDELTLRFAKATDLWLHTKDIPGAHVIISANNNIDIPETTIREAALLAAKYSKAKNSSKVPVDIVLKKYVKKPSGSRPGFVIYEKNKTVYVTPTDEDISKISKIT